MSFANPVWLFLFVPLAFAAWRLLRRGRRAGIRFSAVGRLPAKAAGWRAALASFTPYLLIAAVVIIAAVILVKAVKRRKNQKNGEEN